MNQPLEKTYPSVKCDAKAYVAKDVYVAANRAVFNKDWTLNYEASQHYLYWDSNFRGKYYAGLGISFEQRCDEVRQTCQKLPVQYFDGPDEFALCTHYNNGYPFGNWYETLASLRFVTASQFKVLATYSAYPGVAELPLHFELAGFSPEQVCYYDKSRILPFVETLHCPYIDRWIGSTTIEKIEMPELQRQWRNQRFAWIRDRYLTDPRVVQALDHVPRKLYLSRNAMNRKRADYNRKVLNEETEILPYLQQRGFTVVHGTEPLLTLINYFHSATDIVFPHGSLIHNALFCSNRPKIVEFVSEYRLRNHFYLLFNELASSYDMLVAKADNAENNNICIDLKTLEQYL